MKLWVGVLIAALSSGCGRMIIEPIGAPDEGAGGTCTAPEPTTSTRTGTDRQVRDMTAEEARAWCETYVTQRYPTPHAEPSPPYDRGPHYPAYSDGYAATYCWKLVPGGACITQPTIDDCVTNVMHAPCEATIASLDDCVDSFFNYDGPEDTCNPVGSGCAAFEGAPHCAETVIMSWSLQPPSNPPAITGYSGPCLLRLAPECD